MSGYLYNPDSAFRMAINWFPTILPYIIADVLAVLAIAAIMLLITEIFFRDEDLPGELKGVGDVLDKNKQTIMVSYAITAGFAASITYGRWWAQRTMLQAFMGNTRNASMQLSTYVTCPKSREALTRYLSVAFAWTIWSLRAVHKTDPVTMQKGDEDPQELPDVDSFQKWLVDKNLLTEEEAVILKEGDTQPQILYQWFLMGTAQCAENGTLRGLPVSQIDLQKFIAEARGASSGLLMYLKTPFPFPFYHYVRITGLFLLFTLGFSAFYLFRQGSSNTTEVCRILPVRIVNKLAHVTNQSSMLNITQISSLLLFSEADKDIEYNNVCNLVEIDDEDSAPSTVASIVPLLTASLQAAAASSLFHLLRALANPWGTDVCDFPLEKLWKGTTGNLMANLKIADSHGIIATGNAESGVDGIDVGNFVEHPNPPLGFGFQ